MKKSELIEAAETVRRELLDRYKEEIDSSKKYKSSSEYHNAQAVAYKMAALLMEVNFKDVLKETPLFDEVAARLQAKKQKPQG